MSSGSLKPQRFYLTIEPRKDGHYSTNHYNAKPFIDMMVFGDEDATGIEQPIVHSQQSTGIYNLQGQIYIMGGKKYIAK